MKPDKRKPETIIADLKRQLKVEREVLNQVCQQRDGYRVRATRAEQKLTEAGDELAEWKRRFDALLERTPKVPS